MLWERLINQDQIPAFTANTEYATGDIVSIGEEDTALFYKAKANIKADTLDVQAAIWQEETSLICKRSTVAIL